MNKFYETLYRLDEHSEDDSEVIDDHKLIFKGILEEFYETIKKNPNVLSGNDIYSIYDSFNPFSNSIWKKKRIGIRLEKQSIRHSDGLKIDNRETWPILFGLSSGICFQKGFDDFQVFFINGPGEAEYQSINLLELPRVEIKNNSLSMLRMDGSNQEKTLLKYISPNDCSILNELIKSLNTKIIDFEIQVEKEIESKNKEFLSRKEILLKTLDKDNDGELDLIENDFDKLLHKNQTLIIEIDKSYLHQFIKISQYIKTKKQNLQNIFVKANESSNYRELEDVLNLLRNQVHTYESLIFHSINMIGSLNKQDLITFYEIYEAFDKLKIFNSNWENDVSDKLIIIGDKLDDLLYSLNQMELSIVSEINNLSYVTHESFKTLNESVTRQLKEVKSTVNTSNLLNAIQTYQLYKFNNTTK